MYYLYGPTWVIFTVSQVSNRSVCRPGNASSGRRGRASPDWLEVRIYREASCRFCFRAGMIYPSRRFYQDVEATANGNLLERQA